MRFLFILLFAFVAQSAYGVCYNQQVMTTAPAGSDHLTTDNTDPTMFGAGINLSGCTYGSFQVNWTSLAGTLNAVVSLEVSSDSTCSKYIVKSNASGSPVNFTLSGANGADSISLNGVVTEKCYRVRYAHTGVTGGTINTFVIGK